MKKNFDRVFKTGDKLQLKLDSRPNKKYHAIVEEVIDQNELLICIDNFSNPINRLYNGLIHLTAHHDEMGIFQMAGHKTTFSSEERYTYIGIKIAKDYQIIQRRQYFRLKLLREIELVSLNGHKIKGMTNNISAGGIKFVAPLDILTGAKFIVNFKLDDNDYSYHAVCLGNSLSFDGRSHVIRAKFIELEDRDRQSILAGMFSLQRNRRE